MSEPGGGTIRPPADRRVGVPTRIGYGDRPVRLALIAYIVLLAAHLAWAWRSFGRPDELFHGPAVLVHHAAAAMRGGSIYGDWREPPYVATVYGPLSYVLPGWIGRCVGAGVSDLYQIGRALSLLAAFGTGLAVYGLARRFAVGRALAAVAMLAALSSPVFWTISGSFRGEPAAVFFSLLAIWWFCRFERTGWWGAAGLFVCAAFLFKQSAVLPVPAIAIYLWMTRRRRAAAAFALATGAGLALIVAALTAAAGGGYRLNAFEALHGNRTLSNLAIWPMAVLPVCLAQYGFACVRVRQAWAARHVGPVECYFLVSLVVPIAMTWRDGAAEYYFCESVAAASVLMVLQWRSWLRSARRWPAVRRRLAMIGLFPTAVAVAGLLQMEPGAIRRLAEAAHAGSGVDADRARQAAMVMQLDALPSPVLCTVDGLTVLGRREPVILDTWLFSGMLDQGIFDDRAIRADLEAGAFRSVVLRLPVTSVRRWGSTYYVPRPWLRIIAQRYHLGGRLGGEYYVYLPNRGPVPAVEPARPVASAE